MEKHIRLLQEKEGIITIKSFQYTDSEYTITTIIVDPNDIYIPTVETKPIEQGVFAVARLIDEGYKYIDPDDKNEEVKLLSKSVTKPLSKLGFEVSNYFNPYDKEEVETPLGKRIIPAAIGQFEYIGWHNEGQINAFETKVNGDKINDINFGIGGDLSEYFSRYSAIEGAYYMVGHYDGGNYILLFNLDDSEISDPMVYKMDHDPDPDDDDPAYTLCRLSEFVSKIKKIK
jgi:hypothetical protein